MMNIESVREQVEIAHKRLKVTTDEGGHYVFAGSHIQFAHQGIAEGSRFVDDANWELFQNDYVDVAIAGRDDMRIHFPNSGEAARFVIAVTVVMV